MFGDLCLGEISSVFYRMYQSYMNEEMKEYDLNFSECSYLVKIPESSSITQSEIGDLLFLDNAIVTRSIQRLEKKGFVSRIKSKEDKRAMLVSLTKKGLDARKVAKKKRTIWKDEVMSDISDSEKEIFEKVLKSITCKGINMAKKGSDFNGSL